MKTKCILHGYHHPALNSNPGSLLTVVQEMFWIIGSSPIVVRYLIMTSGLQVRGRAT